MLQTGTLIADRFVVGALLGQGGMGEVYRALDKATGSTVAIKVMRDARRDTSEAARFAAEIGLLEELAHPGIVAHIAHGTTEEGRPFLAMEHLEGEDLAALLARRSLSLDEALTVVERAASALDQAHRRGVVHRDLKPQNLFLRGGSPEHIVLLDFGIARRAGAGRALTVTGEVIGTPQYMAPEQVQGSREIGPPTDVFALGCVLYECLAGKPPFVGEQLFAILGKILFEQPQPLPAAVPEPIRALVPRMLAKAPADRPRDAAAVLEALAAARAASPAARPESAAGIGAAELELVTVVIATHARAAVDDATLDADAEELSGAEAARDSLIMRGVPIERLADGSIVTTLAGVGESAADQAMEAAACARLIQMRWPDAVIAVATARRIAGAGMLGEALERAAALLPKPGAAPVPSALAQSIRLDDVTHALLEGRVRTAVTPGRPATLAGELSPVDESRPLLGKATPCVGREQELGTLEVGLASCFDDGTARAVLVVAPAGLGKSRLRHELLRRLEQRRAPDARPLFRLEGRGELMRAGSPYAVLDHALRRCFDIGPTLDAARAHEKLLAGVARFLPPAEARPTAEFLGELCDLRFPDERSPKLRAARQEPRVMAARIAEAFVALLRAASAEHDVLVLLEDLHWGDRRSIDLVGQALRDLESCPIFVAAFARPEVHELFPDLWKGRVVEIPLRPLSRRACERFVQRIAGDRLDATAAARIVDQCAGNALYLEELLRAACEGRSDTAPDTVLAMLQARIARLEPAERRLLRAASVFGENFEAEGLLRVLGPAGRPEDVDAALASLARQEILEPPRDGGTCRFRHGLMREAAYGLLTDHDRRLGHHLAAGWLAAREHDPAIVAEHHVRADEPAEAVRWFLEAAQRAQAREEYAAVDQLCERARACGAAGEVLGALSAMQSLSAILHWRWDAARAYAEQVIPLVPAGSTAWCIAERVIGQHAAYHNDHAALRASAERCLTLDPLPEARLAYGESATNLASACAQVGLTALGRSLLRRAEDFMRDDLDRYPLLRAWLGTIRSTLIRHTDDDLAPQIPALREALALYEDLAAGTMMHNLTRDVLGEVLCRAGALDEGEAVLRQAFAHAQPKGGYIASHAQLALANGLLARCLPSADAEAEALAEKLLTTPGITPGYQAMARDILAEALVRRGDLAGAEREARAAIALSPHTPVRRWLMVAHLAGALTRAGRASEARAEAEAAVREMDEAGGGGYAELTLLLAAAAAARSAGDATRATDLRARAEAFIDRQARGFADSEARERLQRHAAQRVAAFLGS